MKQETKYVVVTIKNVTYGANVYSDGRVDLEGVSEDIKNVLRQKAKL